MDGWFLYAFPTVTANGAPVSSDYPKIGIWPDGYYMGTQRGFPNGGLDVWVFERDKMLRGQPARQVEFAVGARVDHPARLLDSEWERIRQHFPEENIPDGRPGRKPVATRLVLEAVLWILNAGAQWHMLPQCYPNYKTLHRRSRPGVATRFCARF